MLEASWIICGFIGGIGFAYTNRFLDTRLADRIMTALWSITICTVFGWFAFPAIFEAYSMWKEGILEEERQEVRI